MKNKKVVLIMMTIPVLVIVCSCSPQRRLERLLIHHPELVISDTLVLKDTVFTPTVSADTMFLFSTLPGSIFLKKDNLEIQVLKMHDTLYLSGKCKSDTIIKTLFKPVERIKMIKSNTVDALIKKLPWIVIALIVIAGLIIYLVSKFSRHDSSVTIIPSRLSSVTDLPSRD